MALQRRDNGITHRPCADSGGVVAINNQISRAMTLRQYRGHGAFDGCSRRGRIERIAQQHGRGQNGCERIGMVSACYIWR